MESCRAEINYFCLVLVDTVTYFAFQRILLLDLSPICPLKGKARLKNT